MIKEWSNVDELLAFLNENWPFHPEWPMPGTITIESMCAGDTPLNYVSRWGDVRGVELLLAAGADVNARGDMSVTPLAEAVNLGHVDVARLLLKAGADPHARSEFGSTPYGAALDHDDHEMRQLFSGSHGEVI